MQKQNKSGTDNMIWGMIIGAIVLSIIENSFRPIIGYIMLYIVMKILRVFCLW